MIITPDDADDKRIDEIVKLLYDGGVIPNMARKPALKEGLEMVYELGFKRGFKAAKQEDMPWVNWDEKKEKKENNKK